MITRDSFPLRLGATSYVIDGDLVANARLLAEKVSDMQLVLFEVDDGPSNIPTPQTVAELAAIRLTTGLTYSLHLIDDLNWGDAGDHRSLTRSARLIELLQPLTPFAYVLHLDGRSVRAAETPALEQARWREGCLRGLERLSQWVGEEALLCVENLEGYPPDFVTSVVERCAVSRCVDVGHLWLDGIDPLPHLGAALPRTRMVHLHGLHQGRDHQSLAWMAPEELDPVLETLLTFQFDGVLCLEVFGSADFDSSLQAVQNAVLRII